MRTAAINGFVEAGIYVVESPPSEPARLVLGGGYLPTAYLEIDARTESDFGITTLTAEFNVQYRLTELDVTLWGVPGAHARGTFETCTITFGFPFCTISDTQAIPPLPPEEHKAFMTNPTICDGPKVTTLDVTFYGAPEVVHRATSEDPTPTGCDAVPFDPSFDLQPTVTRADDSTGLEVDLSLPQSRAPDGIATSHLRRAEVTLPEGTTLNPSAAEGLQACTDAEFGDGSREPARCPDASKIGTVDFDVPLLNGLLRGSIYLGQPLSTDPQSTQMLRIFQVAEGFGLNVKIPGYAKADPVTGRITAVFDDLPQVPFSNVHLRFKGGPRGILATPQACGTKTTSATFTPWSGTAPVSIGSSFVVSADGNGAPCPASWPFQPALSAGMLSPQAGGSSAFTFTLSGPTATSTFAG